MLRKTGGGRSTSSTSKPNGACVVALMFECAQSHLEQARASILPTSSGVKRSRRNNTSIIQCAFL